VLCRVVSCCVLSACCLGFLNFSHHVPRSLFHRFLNIITKNATATVRFINHRRCSRRRLHDLQLGQPLAEWQCVGHDGVVIRAAAPDRQQWRLSRDDASILEREGGLDRLQQVSVACCCLFPFS
jgi:hypothetical protein